jgi:hypothetical protein
LIKKEKSMSPSVAMRFRHWLVVALGVSLVSLFPRIVVAQSTPGATPAGIMIAKGTTPQGFPYLAGGISTNERDVMEEWGKSYNVKLSFAEKRGSYIAGVRLVIEGAKGVEIVNSLVDGPWFYIELPAGGIE